jgi:hypothetical protein
MAAVAEKRLSNSEQQLQRIAEEEAKREEPKGILELFPRDEDAPLARDDADD